MGAGAKLCVGECFATGNAGCSTTPGTAGCQHAVDGRRWPCNMSPCAGTTHLIAMADTYCMPGVGTQP
eukprot:10469850-Alexandrium_andersonii.AAC.1